MEVPETAREDFARHHVSSPRGALARAMEPTGAVALVAAGNRLYERGLNHATSGNLSVRMGDRMLVKPAAVPYDRLRPEELSVVVLADGRHVGGLPPSSEHRMHLAVYRARADVQAIVHAHPPHASAFAVARKPIPPVLDESLAFLGGEVPCADYAPSGDAAVGEHVARALGATGVAALMANHGAVTVGRTLDEAMGAMEHVEHLARVVLLAEAAGGAKAVPEAGVKAMRAIFERGARRY
ncbi:MAG TPA: class II aldolase/adducin family protein [Candidatus Thermoplasmatota archaeon]|nr:class II aldolase/adducin family protein [Candidatus Thermoplasmatota archaeon]